MQEYESAFADNGYDSLPHLMRATAQELDEIAEDLQMKVVKKLFSSFLLEKLAQKTLADNMRTVFDFEFFFVKIFSKNRMDTGGDLKRNLLSKANELLYHNRVRPRFLR